MNRITCVIYGQIVPVEICSNELLGAAELIAEHDNMNLQTLCSKAYKDAFADRKELDDEVLWEYLQKRMLELKKEYAAVI